MVKPKSGDSKNFDWVPGQSSFLSEIGSLHLEFVYLSFASDDLKYAEKVCQIRKHLDRMDKPFDALYYATVNPETGRWGAHLLTLGAFGDSFYEYLIKSWIQSNRTDSEARRMFDAAVDAIEKHMIRKSRSGLLLTLLLNIILNIRYIICAQVSYICLNERTVPLVM